VITRGSEQFAVGTESDLVDQGLVGCEQVAFGPRLRLPQADTIGAGGQDELAIGPEGRAANIPLLTDERAKLVPGVDMPQDEGAVPAGGNKQNVGRIEGHGGDGVLVAVKFLLFAGAVRLPKADDVVAAGGRQKWSLWPLCIDGHTREGHGRDGIDMVELV